MLKVISLTVLIYFILEIICHLFAVYVAKIIERSNQKASQSNVLHKKFIQQTFYRLMLLFSIFAMNHLYAELVFFEKNQNLVYAWSACVIVILLFLVWWLNAYIIRSAMLHQVQKQAVVESYKEKISYIMLHFKEYLAICNTEDYLKKSAKLNYFLSFIAFILLFFDIKILYF